MLLAKEPLPTALTAGLSARHRPGLSLLARGLLALAGLLLGFSPLIAGPLAVPNGSFESPALSYYVDLRVDAWQKTPKPVWFDEGANGPWDQLVGVFTNSLPPDPTHIDNVDGRQAIWIFSVPTAGLFLDYDAVDHANQTHQFDVRYQAGRSYRLTFGIFGGGGGMNPGASLAAAFYYRDASSNQVPIAMTNVVFTTNLFPNTTHLVDIPLDLPPVQPDDPWVNQRIGLLLVSSVQDSGLMGGYWDLDNVRLTETQAPQFSGYTWAGGQLEVQFQSEPGTRFELLASPNLAVPMSGWTSLGVLTNLTGQTNFLIAPTNRPGMFLRARQAP